MGLSNDAWSVKVSYYGYHHLLYRHVLLPQTFGHPNGANGLPDQVELALHNYNIVLV